MLDFFPLANIGRILLIHHIQFTNYVELFMRAYIAREMPDLPCTVYFTDEEWKALCCYTTGSPLSPKQPPSLDSATRMVGAMGGHLGRKRDGPPGAQTLWRGVQRLDPAAKVYRILTTGPPRHASGP